MISLLLANWRGIAIALLIAAAAGYVMTLRLERDAARHDLAAAQQESAALTDRLRLQNEAVEKLKLESDAKVKAVSDGLAKATQASQAARTQAATLRQALASASAQNAPRQAGCTLSGADKAVEAIRAGLK